MPFSGFELLLDAIDGGSEAEASLIEDTEGWPWLPSQSGRWKKDFGPRANFKKQRRGSTQRKKKNTLKI